MYSRLQKDMGEISDRVRKELISPQKIVSAKIVKFSKNGFPVVRFTGQFTWIGLVSFPRAFGLFYCFGVISLCFLVRCSEQK